jgi:hypothetical protein
VKYYVPPEQLPEVWPKVKDWIARALEYDLGDEELPDIFLAIARGIYGLWYSPGEFAAVYQIEKKPRQLVATVLYCGGDSLDAVKLAFAYAEEVCATHGIQVLRMWGRPGWERALPGVERKVTMLQKRFEAQVPLPVCQPAVEARLQ